MQDCTALNKFKITNICRSTEYNRIIRIQRLLHENFLYMKMLENSNTVVFMCNDVF